jgi:hypothetical protein
MRRNTRGLTAMATQAAPIFDAETHARRWIAD